MRPVILYPCQYGKIFKVDEDYAFEKIEADKQGFETLIFNFDDFFTLNKKIKISYKDSLLVDVDKQLKATRDIRKAIYRGWMLNIDEYTKLYNTLLEEYDIELINTPMEYENTHYFIKSYDKIKEHTPSTVWYLDKDKIHWNKLREQGYKRLIIKDFVKSVKGFNFPDYLDLSLSDTDLDAYVKQFKVLRGNLYTGGIVLKEYVDLEKNYEYRVFYCNGLLKSVQSHIDSALESEKYIKDIYEIAMKHEFSLLDSKFYTIDFARLVNGEYRVIEIGDGQVSGIQENYVKQFYSSIKDI